MVNRNSNYRIYKIINILLFIIALFNISPINNELGLNGRWFFRYGSENTNYSIIMAVILLSVSIMLILLGITSLFDFKFIYISRIVYFIEAIVYLAYINYIFVLPLNDLVFITLSVILMPVFLSLPKLFAPNFVQNLFFLINLLVVYISSSALSEGIRFYSSIVLMVFNLILFILYKTNSSLKPQK